MARDPRHRSGDGDERLDTLLADTLGAEPVPRLSPGFEARLTRRLEVERALDEVSEAARRPRLDAPGRWLLHLYWAAAAAGSLAIVGQLDLTALAAAPGGSHWLALAALLLTAAGLAVPYLALRRAGGSLLGLLRRAL